MFYLHPSPYARTNTQPIRCSDVGSNEPNGRTNRRAYCDADCNAHSIPYRNAHCCTNTQSDHVYNDNRNDNDTTLGLQRRARS